MTEAEQQALEDELDGKSTQPHLIAKANIKQAANESAEINETTHSTSAAERLAVGGKTVMSRHAIQAYAASRALEQGEEQKRILDSAYEGERKTADDAFKMRLNLTQRGEIVSASEALADSFPDKN